MTGTFDFVSWIIPFAQENDMVSLTEKILRTALNKNENRNFRNWINGKKMSENFDEYDLEDLEDLYDDFHDLDHHYNHKVFGNISINLLEQFGLLFCDYYRIRREQYIVGNQIRTLKKYVPEIMDYINKYYSQNVPGFYQLKEDKNG